MEEESPKTPISELMDDPTEYPATRKLEMFEAELEHKPGNFRDFIGIWSRALPESACQGVIDMFELATADLNAWDQFHIQEEKRHGGKINRETQSVQLNPFSSMLTGMVNKFLQPCLTEYIERYAALKQTTIFSPEVKVQKTADGGGYHTWHYESSAYDSARRCLTWMIYLNDVPPGSGETEFLYQKLRIQPTRGTIVIWPAGFTHTHRGNPVYNATKYIATGWYIVAPPPFEPSK